MDTFTQLVQFACREKRNFIQPVLDLNLVAVFLSRVTHLIFQLKKDEKYIQQNLQGSTMVIHLLLFRIIHVQPSLAAEYWPFKMVNAK